MDPRIQRHAEVLTQWSQPVQAGETVLIETQEGGEPLAEALVAEVARQGGQPLVVLHTVEGARAFFEAASDDTIKTEPAHIKALAEATDLFFFIEAGVNTRTLAGVDLAKQQARMQTVGPIREIRLAKRWCLTIHPTPALAQEAGMSTPDFADLVYDSILIDWAELAKELNRLADRLEPCSEMHIVAEDTDLYLPVKGRPWVASEGHANMPSGEVFTAPHENAVEGHVVLDLPAVVAGQEVQGVRLVFEKGEVVDWSAERGRDAVRTLLDTDDGAKRLGELGIGLNRGITVPTKNILLDEKMGGTVHLALGRAYKENKGVNESAVHQDLIKTMGKGSYLSADGEVIQRDGVFWFEKGFR